MPSALDAPDPARPHAIDERQGGGTGFSQPAGIVLADGTPEAAARVGRVL